MFQFGELNILCGMETNSLLFSIKFFWLALISFKSQFFGDESCICILFFSVVFSLVGVVNELYD